MVKDIQTAAEKELARVIKKASEIPSLRRIGPRSRAWDIDLQVCGSAKMRQVNRVQRGVDSVTDVLSFPSGEPFFSQGYLGSLLICQPVLLKQAKQIQKIEPQHKTTDELQVLLIHGLLHLLGFDHEGTGSRSKAEALKMRKMEERLAGLVMKRPKGLIQRTLIG